MMLATARETFEIRRTDIQQPPCNVEVKSAPLLVLGQIIVSGARR